MSLRIYTRIWLFIFLLFCFESSMLNRAPEFSIISSLKNSFGIFPHMGLNPQPGKSISLFLGWTGLILMLLTNIYIIRKRLFPTGWGKLSGWLDFHIFCGLLGPTFILFHTNFKVGGLVGLSFWSMVVAFISGVIGRYFYLQLAGREVDIEKLTQYHETEMLKHSSLAAEKVQEIKSRVLLLLGVKGEGANLSLMRVLYLSVWGDMKIDGWISAEAAELDSTAQEHLRMHILLVRKYFFLDHFRKLMGYWHSFHMPFALFMYVGALIHILTALLFAVPSA